MTLFAPACPEQAYFKAAVYGPPGSGKTFTALLWAEGLAKREGKKVAFVDTERGTDFYAQEVAQRAVHPAKFDFDVLHTRSLLKLTEAVREVVAEKAYGVIVIDSISHFWDSAKDAYVGNKTSIGSIPLAAWGPIKKPYKDLMRVLLDASIHILLLGRQKSVFEEDGDGDLRKVGVDMRAEGETPYEPHICVRLEAKRNPRNTTSTTYLAYFEKDRSGVLAGRTVANPTFETLAPILGLLGTKQATSEDPDEVAAADSELLTKGAEKQAAKVEKSREHLAVFQAKVQAAGSPAELGAVRDEMKKVWRYIVDEDRKALEVLYTARRDKIVAAAVPAEVV